MSPARRTQAAGRVAVCLALAAWTWAAAGFVAPGAPAQVSSQSLRGTAELRRFPAEPVEAPESSTPLASVAVFVAAPGLGATMVSSPVLAEDDGADSPSTIAGKIARKRTDRRRRAAATDAQDAKAAASAPEQTNIRGFDDLLGRMRSVFIPLQSGLSEAEATAEQKKAEVKSIEKAELVLKKMEAKETAIMDNKAPVKDPFAKDDLETLKAEEKGVAVLVEAVEEIKRSTSDPAEKNLLDKVEREAEKDKAIIIKDEVVYQETRKKKPRKNQDPKVGTDNQNTKEAPKEATEASKPAPQKEAPKQEVQAALPTTSAQDEVKETPKEAAAILKEEQKVMKFLEEKKEKALGDERSAEATAEEIRKAIAIETQKEERQLKTVKDDFVKEAKKESLEKNKDMKEVAKELEQKAEVELRKVKEEIKEEAKLDNVDAEKEAVMQVEKKAEDKLKELDGIIKELKELKV